MSDTRIPAVRTDDVAWITYGDDRWMTGVVTKIVTTRTGNLRRVGITPDGTDVIAWFSPAPDASGLVSVGGHTVAYV
jgi:hypothetical protein